MASLDVIRTLTMRAKAEGFAEAKSQVTGLGEAYDTSARRQLSMDKSLQSLERRFISGAKEAQDFAKIQQQVNLIIAQSPQLHDRTNAVLASAAERMKLVSNTTDKFALSTKSSRYELLNLSRQLQDVGVGIVSGQRGFTILVQQGSQIFDAFQSASASGRSLGQAILGLITPFRLLTLGILGAAAAGVLLIKSAMEMDKQLLDLSERIDVPIEKLRALSSVAAGRGIDPTEFNKGMEAFGDQVDRAKLGLGEVAELFRRNGKSSGDWEKSLENVADLIKNAATGAQRYRLLQEAGLPATAEWVRLLSVGGAALAAQIEDQRELNKRNADLAIQARAFNEAWSAAWDNFVRNAQNAALASASFIGSLITKAGEFVTAVQTKVLSIRGFTPEQAQRRLGESALGAGVGTQLDAGTANKFYDSMRGAAGEAKKIENSVSTTNKDARELAALEQRRVSMLGNLATTAEVVAAKARELNEANAQGVGLDAKRVAQLIEIARLEDISKKSSARVSVLGESATAAEKYVAAVDQLRVKLKDETITQADFNRKLIEINPVFGNLADHFGEFINTYIQGMQNGASATDALAASLKQLGQSITSSAIKDLGNVLVKQLGASSVGQSLGTGLGSLFGTGASAFGGPLAGAAIGGGISLIGSLFDNSKKKADEQAQIQALQQLSQASTSASDALNGVVKSFQNLTAVAQGPTSTTIEGAISQFQQLQVSAEAAKAAAGALAGKGGAGSPEAALGAIQFQAAQKAVDDARRALQEFEQRTVDAAREALRGSDALSSIAQKMKDLRDEAEDVNAAMRKLGVSAEDARAAVEDDLAVALKRLADQVSGDLTKQINQLTGKGWINDLNDMFQSIADAQALGVDPALVRQFLTVKAQDIVNSAKLTGAAFDELITTFPQLAGVVTAFTDTIAEDASRAKALQDRLFNALNDTSTLTGQLAAFDRQAAQQRADEAAAGGANMVLLEQVLAAERLNIIVDFNKKAVESEQAAAKQRQDAINTAAKNIADYLNGLMVGSGSALSPFGRLQAAQSAFNAQLTLAQGGNLEAQGTITQFAEDLRKAGQDFFGSSQGFQTILANIQQSLAALPVVQQTTDPVVQAMLGVQNAVEDTTAAVQDTTSAVDTASVQAEIDASIQTGVLSIMQASTDAQTAQITSTAALQASANSLIATSNAFLGSMNSLLESNNSILTVSGDSLGHLSNIENAVGQLFSINDRLGAIESHTSHTYSPGGSLNYALASGGWVGAAGAASRMFKLAGGGSVGTDTVPAMLTPGEFVVRRSVAQANAGFLTQLNAGGFVGNDNNPNSVNQLLARIENLLQRIAALEERGNEAIAQNTMATVGQTTSLNRESRFQSRKAS